jgi:hypothetical protein
MDQLDIFEHSGERMRVNDLADALMAADSAAARAAADTLADEHPSCPELGAAARLVEALAAEASAADTTFADSAAAGAACEQLAGEIARAAQALLGSDPAAVWLAARWRALAHRARALPFDASATGAVCTHAAAMWLQAGAWPQAQAAVRHIESWRRKPQPLAWMARATWHADGPDAAWPLLAELAWLAPARLPPLLIEAGQQRALRRFESAFDEHLPGGFDDGSAWVWLPAWLLIDDPRLAAPLAAADTSGATPPERALQLMRSLLRLERQGAHHERTALRAELKTLHPPLFALYMATRA